MAVGVLGNGQISLNDSWCVQLITPSIHDLQFQSWSVCLLNIFMQTFGQCNCRGYIYYNNCGVDDISIITWHWSMLQCILRSWGCHFHKVCVMIWVRTVMHRWYVYGTPNATKICLFCQLDRFPISWTPAWNPSDPESNTDSSSSE